MIYTSKSKTWKATNTIQKIVAACTPEALEKFWALVDKAGDDDCWLWKGPPAQSRGYGNIQFAGLLQRAHRVSWMIHYGVIPGDMHVCHECDVRLCVNPRHLWLGTNHQNHLDRVAKGQSKGEKQGGSRLTSADVLKIRRSHKCDRTLAKEYSVHPTTIYSARVGRNWTHLPMPEGKEPMGRRDY